MPYWNKYPLRDRAGDHAKPTANLTSRGMGVPQRTATFVREAAEAARHEAETSALTETAVVAIEHEGTKA